MKIVSLHNAQYLPGHVYNNLCIFMVQFNMSIPGDDRFYWLFVFLHKYPSSASNKGLNRHLSAVVFMRKWNRPISKPSHKCGFRSQSLSLKWQRSFNMISLDLILTILQAHNMSTEKYTHLYHPYRNHLLAWRGTGLNVTRTAQVTEIWKHHEHAKS